MEPWSVEARREPGSMRNGLVLRFTGVALMLVFKMKLGAHYTLIPPDVG